MNTLRVFNHYVHVKYMVLGLAQLVVLVVCVAIAAQLRFMGQAVPLTSDWTVILPKALIFSAAIMISMSGMGLYHPQRRDSHLQVLIRVLISFMLAMLALTIIFYFIPELYLGRGIMALAIPLALVGSVAIQGLFYRNIDKRDAPWRVLFYGAGDNAASILAFLRRRSDRRLFTLAGCVPANGENARVGRELLRTPRGSLLEYAKAHRIDEIVVAMDDRRQQFPTDELFDCRIAGINVIDTLTFYERQTGKIKTELLHPSWIIFSYGFRRTPFQDALKRFMDLLFSALMLLLLSPVMLAAAIAIWLDEGSNSPVFFSQERVGKDGQHFRIHKFRSMRTDAEAAGVAQWASTDDPRVTRVGHYLRKYRIDELPQLINVMQGHMSLVGPRPERPQFVAELAKSLSYYRMRELAKPGITGWAQVGYPYGASEEDALGKLQLDLYYVKNRSMFLDLLILLGTFEVILFSKGGR